MTRYKRNRSQGWEYAKKSGHINEKLVADLLYKDSNCQSRLLKVAGVSGDSFVSAETDGIHEKDVPGIFGEETKNKTDIVIKLKSGKRINVSVKKDKGGQAYLLSVDSFIKGMERQYGLSISSSVKDGISLFWGTSDEVDSIIAKYTSKYSSYEKRKHRLVHEVMSEATPKFEKDMIQWMGDNADKIFDFCFSRGLAVNSEDYADILWYKNMVGDNELDYMFNIREVEKIIPHVAEYGTKNGGTTVVFPFGFAQWHSPRKKIPGLIQIHHSYSKILDLVNKYKYGK